SSAPPTAPNAINAMMAKGTKEPICPLFRRTVPLPIAACDIKAEDAHYAENEGRPKPEDQRFHIIPSNLRARVGPKSEVRRLIRQQVSSIRQYSKSPARAKFPAPSRQAGRQWRPGYFPTRRRS